MGYLSSLHGGMGADEARRGHSVVGYIDVLTDLGNMGRGPVPSAEKYADALKGLDSMEHGHGFS
jgi:hypothetical protein